MLDWLPEFLDGLFFMLSDENKELRQAGPLFAVWFFSSTCGCRQRGSILFAALAHGRSHVNHVTTQAAGQCLDEFLREIKTNAATVDFAPMVPILIAQCGARDVRTASIYSISLLMQALAPP